MAIAGHSGGLEYSRSMAIKLNQVKFYVLLYIFAGRHFVGAYVAAGGWRCLARSDVYSGGGGYVGGGERVVGMCLAISDEMTCSGGGCDDVGGDGGDTW